jgi:F-type H+-transporting ATPase subunit b
MEGASFTSQLGIDWKLLLSQVVNFVLLLIILRMFVYDPISKVVKKRKEKIEEGLAKAEEAGIRLREADEIAKKKLKVADGTAMATIAGAEEKAKELEAELTAKAREKEALLMKKTDADIRNKKEQAQREMEKEAIDLIKKALVKTVELSPDKIDEALIEKAVEQVI